MYFLIKRLLRIWRGRQARSTAPATATRSSRPAAWSEGGASPAARGTLALLTHQIRFDVLTSMRNPRARFFTFFFPILFLVVFNGVFGSGDTIVAGHHVKLKIFYVPGILAMSIVVATYANMVISLTAARDAGILKRRRATPVPAALLIAGQAAAAVVITAMTSTIVLVVAKLLYGVGIAAPSIAAIACIVLVGTLAFACIAYAVSGLIGSPEASQPIVQITMLPLWFISGVFIPDQNLSPTLKHVASLFPVEHVANSLHLASVNSSFGAAISATDVLALAAWGIGAAAFAAWRFSWLPSTATA